MTAGKSSVFLVVFTFLWTFTRGDVDVSCVFMQSCILPCSFQADSDVVIHWMIGNSPVHSYYHNQDQLAHQDQRFRGRTSLFKDQISRGNASLQFTEVQFQDQGKYKCYTSTITGNKESFINLQVEAPVRKVNFQLVENRITCSTDGIYPEPVLTWSTRPPSNLTVLDKTTVQNQQQLYNIKSSLLLSDRISDLVYSCTISTGRNRRRATLFQQTNISGSHTETTIPCTPSNTPLTGLRWRFKHSQIILSQTSADVPYIVSDEWRKQVKGVSESGSLTLQDLSSNHEGIYTCELSTAEEDYITDTCLSIEQHPDYSTNAAKISAGVIGAILLAVVVGLTAFCVYKKRKDRNSTISTESQGYHVQENGEEQRELKPNEQTMLSTGEER